MGIYIYYPGCLGVLIITPWKPLGSPWTSWTRTPSLLQSEVVSSTQMQEEERKIDFGLLRGWMYIGFRDFMQFIRLVGGIQYTISPCFKFWSSVFKLDLFEMSQFDYMPYLVIATIGATPSHEFLSIYPQTWYIKYMYL